MPKATKPRSSAEIRSIVAPFNRISVSENNNNCDYKDYEVAEFSHVNYNYKTNSIRAYLRLRHYAGTHGFDFDMIGTHWTPVIKNALFVFVTKNINKVFMTNTPQVSISSVRILNNTLTFIVSVNTNGEIPYDYSFSYTDLKDSPLLAKWCLKMNNVPIFTHPINWVYTRVSSEKQNTSDNVSIDVQKSEIKKFLERTTMITGDNVVVMTEIASGRANTTVCAKQRELNFIVTHCLRKNDSVYVYSIDRFSRSRVVGTRLLEKIDAAKATLFSVTEHLESSNIHHRKMMFDLLNTANALSDSISQKVIASQQFIPYYGYKIIMDNNEKKRIYNPEEINIIKMILTSIRDKHETPMNIACKFQDLKIMYRNNKPFSSSIIHRIFKKWHTIL